MTRTAARRARRILRRARPRAITAALAASLAASLGAGALAGCAEDDDPAFTQVPTTVDEPGIGPGSGFGGRRDSGTRDGGLDRGVDPDDGIPRDAATRDAAATRDLGGGDRGLPDIGELRDLDPTLPDIGDIPDAGDIPDVGGMTRVDTGVEPQCARAADCDLAVQLDRCDPCPIAVPVDALAADRCLVRYIPGATLGTYAPADCWADCGEAIGEACDGGPIEATCEGAAQGAGRCVPF